MINILIMRIIVINFKPIFQNTILILLSIHLYCIYFSVLIVWRLWCLFVKIIFTNLILNWLFFILLLDIIFILSINILILMIYHNNMITCWWQTRNIYPGLHIFKMLIFPFFYNKYNLLCFNLLLIAFSLYSYNFYYALFSMSLRILILSIWYFDCCIGLI